MVLFITRWVSIEVTAILTIGALVATGLLDTEEALSGFSNPATITIVCMFILSEGLTRTGTLDWVAKTLKEHSKGSSKRFMLLLGMTVPIASAFMNNTPVVVMMVPVVLSVARDLEEKPSKFLIPLSYFAILGGTCTLIGTNTNILVDQLYRDMGGDGFKMFDFTPLGITYLSAGAIFVTFALKALLPERTSLSALISRHRTARFVTEVILTEESLLVGECPVEVFTKESGLKLIELVRGETVILAQESKQYSLEVGDALIIEGNTKVLGDFLASSKVSLPTVIEDDKIVHMHSMELMMGEAVVLPESPFVGRSVASLRLNRRFGVKILAVQRRGLHHRYHVREMILKPGDVLLVQATEEGFGALRDTEAVLVVEAPDRAIASHKPAWIAVGIMAAVVASASLTPIPLVLAALLGCAGMFIARCLSVEEAVRSIETTVIFLLAGTIPLGHAMEKSGMAEIISNFMLHYLDAASPVIILSVFYFLTSITTELLSNKATAVLVMPIAMSMASHMGIDPKPLLMAICYGASASFMTPIGYATNTIVMGPGGYRFSDYLRAGIPLNFVMWILATLLIPILWPFTVAQ